LTAFPDKDIIKNIFNEPTKAFDTSVKSFYKNLALGQAPDKGYGIGPGLTKTESIAQREGGTKRETESVASYNARLKELTATMTTYLSEGQRLSIV
jgi:hypothetical protein